MIKLTVNGEPRSLDVDPDMPLLWALRDELGLTGTKYGCGIARCGACYVHMDGHTLPSCVTPVSAAEGKAITTIEGVDSDTARAVRAAWAELNVVQCGYCQSGQIMSAIDLLNGNAEPDDAAINAAMQGNLCRCNTYARIRQAIKQAAASLRAQGGEA
ncbi:oxidoreductase [Thiohalobacter sp. COW1]|uniref:(2Fe-2S)-binding protein n=1 Tax=Thiohalobacter sp. COW1 TaxID=2795687 RepID=UPI0019166F29|nr:(2Fe-2S)-binding protein [Thiohalobacter sp. COW1]BCO30203.1 oxidoreductase [Thiohalobacter sp. COW1]